MTQFREEWLHNAVEKVGVLLAAVGVTVPQVRVAAGWPSSGGLGQKKRVLGECWKPEVAEDGISQIFLNPLMIDPVEILGVLVHELIHAWDKGEHKHAGPFVKACKDVGLTGPWTATSVGDDLRVQLAQIADDLGEYPHSKLNPFIERKPQTTRQIKVECSECGCIVRMTRTWIDKGLPTCYCGTEMTESVTDKG